MEGPVSRVQGGPLNRLSITATFAAWLGAVIDRLERGVPLDELVNAPEADRARFGPQCVQANLGWEERPCDEGTAVLLRRVQSLCRGQPLEDRFGP